MAVDSPSTGGKSMVNVVQLQDKAAAVITPDLTEDIERNCLIPKKMHWDRQLPVMHY